MQMCELFRKRNRWIKITDYCNDYDKDYNNHSDNHQSNPPTGCEKTYELFDCCNCSLCCSCNYFGRNLCRFHRSFCGFSE